MSTSRSRTSSPNTSGSTRPRRTSRRSLVAFSIQSAYDWEEHQGWKEKFPFWTAAEGLVEQQQPFDVVVLPEGMLREDWITAEYLARYRTLVLPGCTVLTPAQVDAIRGYLEHGGTVVATGELGAEPRGRDRASLLGHPHLVRTTRGARHTTSRAARRSVVEPGVDLAVNICRVGDKEAAIHVIRYDYDEERDEVPVLDRMTLDVRLAAARSGRSTAAEPARRGAGAPHVQPRAREMHRIELENVPLYTVILLQ